ncbi:hypothetical protein QQ045_002175 [Rhodiola kirilowii]
MEFIFLPLQSSNFVLNSQNSKNTRSQETVRDKLRVSPSPSSYTFCHSCLNFHKILSKSCSSFHKVPLPPFAPLTKNTQQIITASRPFSYLNFFFWLLNKPAVKSRATKRMMQIRSAGLDIICLQRAAEMF